MATNSTESTTSPEPHRPDLIAAVISDLRALGRCATKQADELESEGPGEADLHTLAARLLDVEAARRKLEKHVGRR